MSKKMTTSDFAEVVAALPVVETDPEVTLTPRYTFLPNPIKIEAKMESTSILIGNTTRVAFPVASVSDCASFANAWEKLYRGTFLPHVEPGLHLNCPMEQLRGIPYDPNIGMLGTSYVSKGEKDSFARHIPSDGWVRLSIRWGMLRAYPVVVHEPQLGEPDSYQHDRNAHGFHSAVDALIGGYTYNLNPVLWKDGVALSGEDLRTARQAWVAKRKELHGMTDEQYRASLRQMLFEQGMYRASGKDAASVQKAEEEGTSVLIDSIPMKDGSIGTLESLNGKELKRYYHNAPIGGTVVVTPADWQRIAHFIMVRDLTAVIIPSVAQ